MARTPRAVWEKRIERLRESELTDAEFAEEIGVNVHTLRSWKWKLKAETTDSAGAVTPRKRSITAPATTFVEMQVAAAEPAAPPIELRVGAVDVRVPAGFDEATLSRVVSLLRRLA